MFYTIHEVVEAMQAGILTLPEARVAIFAIIHKAS